MGRKQLDNISVRVTDGASLERAMVDIERVLRREHKLLPGRPNDFAIVDRREFLDTQQEAQQTFTMLLASIAGVSLLVGGIGIMNIMLVSVTERTREIGIRMALGATRFSVLLQFLVESITLCLLGGVLGIVLGGTAASTLSRLAGWEMFVSPESGGPRVRVQRRRRTVLRHLAGTSRRSPRPDRSLALRIIADSCEATLKRSGMLKLSALAAVAHLPVRLHHASALRPSAAGRLRVRPAGLCGRGVQLHAARAQSRCLRRSAKLGTTTSCDSRSSPSGRNGHPQNLVEGQYFRSRSPGPKPLVVVMPIWGTSSYPPSKISHGYARHSRGEAHVIWIYGTAPLFPWDELAAAPTEQDFAAISRDSVERYRSAVIDMRRLVEWAVMQDEIDASRIAFVGFSMSALVTATLVGNDARIAAAVFMMGAANFADVFATCGDRAGEVRAHALKEFGWSLTEYREFFQGLFGPADPVRFAGRYDPDRILMIDAMFDDCMPESSRAALWEIAGHPERITLLSRHRTLRSTR